jgi:hypothetical protein
MATIRPSDDNGLYQDLSGSVGPEGPFTAYDPTTGRFNSLAGGTRAADKAGDRAKAAALFAALQTLSAKGDGSRPELVALRIAYGRKPG